MTDKIDISPEAVEVMLDALPSTRIRKLTEENAALQARVAELEAANRGLVRLNETTEARAEAAEAKLAATPSPDALIRATLEHIEDYIADYPRVAPDGTEAQHYDEQIAHCQQIIRALADDPDFIARIIKAAEGRE